MIFDHLAPDRPGQVALCRLARTCRGFLDPALDLLWKYQSSLMPLSRCLRDEWSEPQYTEESEYSPLAVPGIRKTGIDCYPTHPVSGNWSFTRPTGKSPCTPWSFCALSTVSHRT
ncbi:hypothetical protein C8R44DRAFT_767109 [Mycena epipterygia]|nr:hypothetical protein C8R44DRAFT_767109 [Mycena epipterygia]